jgi:hypothetical protein
MRRGWSQGQSKQTAVEASLTATAISVDDPLEISRAVAWAAAQAVPGLALQQAVPALMVLGNLEGHFRFHSIPSLMSSVSSQKKLRTNKMWYFRLYTISCPSLSLVVSSR